MDEAFTQTFDDIPTKITWSDPIAIPTVTPPTSTSTDGADLLESTAGNDQFINFQRDISQNEYSEILISVQKDAKVQGLTRFLCIGKALLAARGQMKRGSII